MEEVSPGVFQKRKTALQPRDKAMGKSLPAILDEQKTNHCTVIRQTINSNLNEQIVFKWAGKDISLNQWYSSEHWTKRNTTKKEWHSFFESFMLIPYPIFEAYTVTLEYNSRLDPSNTITMIKLCEDMLQGIGVIKNDTGEYCKGLIITPNAMMKRKSYKLTIKNIQ